jgi:hypothetical protein
MSIKHKAWAIGLGRTGTNSFCDALEILGYGAVEHNPPFEKLKDLDGAADNGCTIFYKYLDFRFPGSKFVLLVRDLESWLASIEYMHTDLIAEDEDLIMMRRMLVYESVYFDRQKFTDAYHRHHEDVHRYFKDRPDDLLEMNLGAGDGWDTLCPFLDLPVPDVPFPHKNQRRTDLASRVKSTARNLTRQFKGGRRR